MEVIHLGVVHDPETDRNTKKKESMYEFVGRKLNKLAYSGKFLGSRYNLVFCLCLKTKNVGLSNSKDFCNA